MLAQQCRTQLPAAVHQQLRGVGSHNLAVRKITWPLVREAAADAMVTNGDVGMNIGSDVVRAAEPVVVVGKAAVMKVARAAAPGADHETKVTESMAKVTVVGRLKTALMKLWSQRPRNQRLLQGHTSLHILNIERCTAGCGGTGETVQNLASAGDDVAQAK